ncbi:MAG: alpha-amylase family glycosyl hydrolase [Chitinophagaceae bacterium]|nr:alpha-amylase family glycosyl hydrolase [Chitinophagaceae bacterium]
MRHLVLTVILTMMLCAFSKAQLLVTTPEFPQDNSSVSIVVDCSKGNQGLFNYGNTNDVYVHVGVITSLSSSSSDWKYVKFTWGTTDPAAKATSLGNNKYKFDINNPRTFFGVPAAETIRKISILFRSGNGNAVQRNADGSDMYISVYSNALAGKFALPLLEPRFIPVPEPVNKNVGDTIRIKYVTNNTADLKIFFNGVQTLSLPSANTIYDSVVLTASGSQQIVARATEGATTISDTISFFVAPPVNISPLPSGAKDGINYEAGDTSALLVLYAPGKSRVSVIGDFNNWIESGAYQMNKTPDGLRHWLRVTGLAPGTEYAYQYFVNGTLKIADPYTTKVLDPNNDVFINAGTYPNLKTYPTGKTTGIVSLLQTAKPAYIWQVNNFTRADKRSLIIYELLLRDFVDNHDWKTLKDSLNYLKNLGINAIELMPFNEFEGNNSWGYNPSFYFAPDKYYGPENRLKEFIDECHKQGIAVLMDIALNHSFGQSPMVQLYFDAANNRPAADNPWFNPTTRHAFNVGYDMNHESLATRYFVSRVVEHWLKEYKIDGFRFDLSKGFTQNNTCDANGNNCNVNTWSAYDASRVAIWKRYYDTLQLKSPGSYVILEHFADNTEEKELSDYGMMFWGNLNFNFNEATMGFLSNSNFSGALHTARGWSQPHLIAYAESHDEERLMYKNINFGNASGSYSTRDINTGLRRNEMAAAFLMMMPGPKMIWQFGETGYDFSINHCPNGTINNNCRVDPKPIKWDYLQVITRKRLYDIYAALNKLRKDYAPVFINGTVANSLAGAFKILQVTHADLNITVVGNFDVVQTTGGVAFQNAGTWYNYLTGETFTATGNSQDFTLAPGEYRLYVNKNVTNPVVTSVSNFNRNPNPFDVLVFPNPATAQSQVNYTLPQNGKTEIALLNITGQVIAGKQMGMQPRGSYYISLESITGAKNIINKGAYIVRVTQNGRHSYEKFMVF